MWHDECVGQTTHLLSGGDHPASHRRILVDVNGGVFEYNSAMNNAPGARKLRRWSTCCEVNEMEDKHHICHSTSPLLYDTEFCRIRNQYTVEFNPTDPATPKPDGEKTWGLRRLAVTSIRGCSDGQVGGRETRTK